VPVRTAAAPAPRTPENPPSPARQHKHVPPPPCAARTAPEQPTAATAPAPTRTVPPGPWAGRRPTPHPAPRPAHVAPSPCRPTKPAGPPRRTRPARRRRPGPAGPPGRRRAIRRSRHTSECPVGHSRRSNSVRRGQVSNAWSYCARVRRQPSAGGSGEAVRKVRFNVWEVVSTPDRVNFRGELGSSQDRWAGMAGRLERDHRRATLPGRAPSTRHEAGPAEPQHGGRSRVALRNPGVNAKFARRGGFCAGTTRDNVSASAFPFSQGGGE
jgi:hypothetical protein